MAVSWEPDLTGLTAADLAVTVVAGEDLAAVAGEDFAAVADEENADGRGGCCWQGLLLAQAARIQL